MNPEEGREGGGRIAAGLAGSEGPFRRPAGTLPAHTEHAITQCITIYRPAGDHGGRSSFGRADDGTKTNSGVSFPGKRGNKVDSNTYESA